MRHPASIGAALLLLTAVHLAAQGDPPPVAIPRDPLSGMGHGLLLGGEDEIVRRFPNQQTARPVAFQPIGTGNTSRPYYSIRGPRGLFPGAGAGDVSLDAMSTGNDVLPVRVRNGEWVIGFEPAPNDPTGVPSWVNVVASLAPGAEGLVSAPPEIRDRLVGPIEADLFSYWFEHNQGTGPEFIDEAYLVDGREHLGLDPTDDIVGVDTFMQWLADSQPDGVIVRRDRDLFFSVTPASIEWLPDTGISRFRGYTLGMPSSDLDALKAKITAATVFHAHWKDCGTTGPNGTSPDWRWDEIEILFTPDELKGDVASLPLDIDALAFDATGVVLPGGDRRRTLLFSEKRTDPPQPDSHSQIRMAVVLTPPPGAGSRTTAVSNAKNGNGTDVRNRIGIRNSDDVDALCTEDPESAVSPYIAGPDDDGIPQSHFGLKAERYLHTTGNYHLAVQVHNLKVLAQNQNTDPPPALLTVLAWVTQGTPTPIYSSTVPFTDDDESFSLALPQGIGDELYLQAILETQATDGSTTVWNSWRLVMDL